MPNKQNTAVIDIGSNSIRYLGDGAKVLITTRLAQGLLATGRLGEEPIRRSLAAIEEFARLAQRQGRTPYAYATSAVRDASNGGEFAACVEAMGVPVRILTGEEEAAFALLGAGSPPGLVDIGGGSCQLVSEGFSLSFPIGCVRARDLCDAAGAETFDAMRDAVFARCKALFLFPRVSFRFCTGVGGTITTLAALTQGLSSYDPAAMEKAGLTLQGVEAIARALLAQGEARKKHPLLRERHDVIVPGALVLLYVMQGMGVERMSVSDADGMEGYLAWLTQGGAHPAY